MKVYFRADASVELGSGHVARCLTVAEVFREKGAEAAFICRELPGNCCELIERRGFRVNRLPAGGTAGDENDARLTSDILAGGTDWLVVDNYGIGREWERRQRPFIGGIMAIDDLADRPHDCDLLLDQNLVPRMEGRYDGLVPRHCRQFLGPRYALLRREFIEQRKRLRQRDGTVQRVVVFFGGSDPTNETEKALLALQAMKPAGVAVDLVVGSANPKAARIKELSASLPDAVFHMQVDNMATLMSQADLALGAGGSTTWERCYLGLPSLLVVVADNQALPAQAADAAGLCRLLGKSSEVTAPGLASLLEEYLRRPDRLLEMGARCLSFMHERESPLHDEIGSCIWKEKGSSGNSGETAGAS